MVSAVAYDEDRIAAISARVAEAIDLAALGGASWSEIPRLLGEEFPGSMISFSNENLTKGEVNLLAIHNIDPDFLESYRRYYAFINPWAAHWYSARSGEVLVAEESCPARLFAHTEFYNDWLRPQRGIEAAVGIKIDAGHGDLVRIPMHYPPSMAARYDRAAVEVLTRIRGNLMRFVRLGRLLRDRVEGTVADAALVERACCSAFVVDGECRVRDANQAAVELFSSGTPVAIRHGGAHLAGSRSDGLFRSGVAALSKGLPCDLARINVAAGSGNWMVCLAALPAVAASAGGMLALFPPRSLVLVLVRNLDAHNRQSSDLCALAAQFGLTPAEILFCERLVKGDSLAEAAGALGIALETARNRSKAIFRKTGTHRQGELIAMLAGLA